LALATAAKDPEDVQRGACAFAGALGELWASANLVDEALELAALCVFKRCPVRPSVARGAFWAGFRRAVRGVRWPPQGGAW
jgi:hypothetical protein